MKQANLIKISEFRVDDGGLLLISKANDLPFLAVDEKGVVFDEGPFTGTFCALEGLSKFFIVKDESGDAFSLQLMFAEGDAYPMGEAQFSVQYNEALCWVIKTNKKIAQKKGDEKEYSRSFAKEVIGKMIDCLKPDEDYLEDSRELLIEKIVASPNFLIEKIVSPKDRENLIEMARERFSIFIPDDSTLPVRTIADVIRLVNTQVKDKKDFQNRWRYQVISERNKNQGRMP